MPMTIEEAKRNTAMVRNLREQIRQARSHNADEFYEFASRIAKRDNWFIGGFLGAVYEEWKDKQSRAVHKRHG